MLNILAFSAYRNYAQPPNGQETTQTTKLKSLTVQESRLSCTLNSPKSSELGLKGVSEASRTPTVGLN